MAQAAGRCMWMRPSKTSRGGLEEAIACLSLAHATLGKDHSKYVCVSPLVPGRPGLGTCCARPSAQGRESDSAFAWFEERPRVVRKTVAHLRKGLVLEELDGFREGDFAPKESRAVHQDVLGSPDCLGSGEFKVNEELEP